MRRFNTIHSTVLLLLATGMAAVLGACGSGNNNTLVIVHTATPTPTTAATQTPTDQTTPTPTATATILVWRCGWRTGPTWSSSSPRSWVPGVSDPAPNIALNSATASVRRRAFSSMRTAISGSSTGAMGPPSARRSTSSQRRNSPRMGRRRTRRRMKRSPTQASSSRSKASSTQAGDFWVADNGANEVVEFTPAQLAAGGLITPTLTLTSTIPFTGPLGIAFSPVSRQSVGGEQRRHFDRRLRGGFTGGIDGSADDRTARRLE